MEEFIRKSDARKAILKENPALAYCINNVRSIEVREAVYGEWKYNRGAARGERAYYCSACFEGESDYGTDNFCPHCGAMMQK